MTAHEPHVSRLVTRENPTAGPSAFWTVDPTSDRGFTHSSLSAYNDRRPHPSSSSQGSSPLPSLPSAEPISYYSAWSAPPS